MTKTVEVVGILWDTEVDGEIQTVDLADTMTIEVEVDGDPAMIGKDIQLDCVLSEAISSKLSDTTGWCVIGWDHYIVK